MNDERLFEDSISEALFRQAVIDSFKMEIENITSDEPFSAAFEAKMAALFKAEKKRAANLAWKRTFKRLSVSAAVLSILLCTIFLSMPKVRAAAKENFIFWFKEYVKFDSGDSKDVLEIEAFWELSYVPVGFIKTQDMQENFSTIIIYTNKDNKTLNLTAGTSEASLSVNNEDVEYGQTLKDGVVYHTFKALKPEKYSCVVWDNEGYRFALSADLSIDELIQIAKGVMKSK